jgi:hypothetical protein
MMPGYATGPGYAPPPYPYPQYGQPQYPHPVYAQVNYTRYKTQETIRISAHRSARTTSAVSLNVWQVIKIVSIEPMSSE